MRPAKRRKTRGPGTRKTLENLSDLTPEQIEQQMGVSWKPVLAKVDKLCAFSYLLYFNNGETDRIVQMALGGEQVDQTSEQFQLLRTWVMATFRHLQHRTISACEVCALSHSFVSLLT